MKNLSYAEICHLYGECHGPSQTADISAMQWAGRMERMIGPDDCKGFLIRGRENFLAGMYLMSGGSDWCGAPRTAKLFTWGEAAVKLTNNPKLEVIRVGHDNIAKDYKGRTVALFGKDKDG